MGDGYALALFHHAEVALYPFLTTPTPDVFIANNEDIRSYNIKPIPCTYDRRRANRPLRANARIVRRPGSRPAATGNPV